MTMPQEQVLDIVLSSDNLPTLPIVASKLLVLTASEDTTLTDIARLVSKDMGLSAKILKVSNSSFYSFPQQIASINQAVSILGTNAVRSLVLSFSFLSMGGKKKNSKFDFTKFWERSLVGATAAKLILEQVEGADTEEIFISGLLQNIGQLIFAATLPDLFEQVVQKFEEDTEEIDEERLEIDIIGAQHRVVGYEVAKKWGFPESLLMPIRYHHSPSEYQSDRPELVQNVRAVYLSDLICKIFYSESPDLYHKQFRNEAKNLLGLKILQINNILKKVDLEVDKAAQYFGIKIKSIKSVNEILQEANIRLSLINLSYEEVNRELVKSKLELEKLTGELEQKNKLLENLVNIDGLTEVHNHRYFHTFLDSEINRSIRHENTISLLLADIDHFKKFNDTYGHQTGDFILKEFCRITKEVIREYDLIARYGGEEFVFVLPETEPEKAMLVAEKIRKTVDDFSFDDGKKNYHVTTSVGVASARPDSPQFNKNDFIGFADEALYEAKGKGRNKVRLYSPKKKKKWLNF